MESSPAPEHGSLEVQLRNMILSNVTISSGQHQQGDSHDRNQQHARGRGRGRGRGFYRGRGRGNQPQTPNADIQAVSTAQGVRSPPDARAGDRDLSQQRSPRHQQRKPPTNPSSPIADGHQAGQAPPTKRGEPRTPTQLQRRTSVDQAEGPASAAPPQILKRPQGHTNSGPNSQSLASNARYTPRVGEPFRQQYMSQPPENPLAQIGYLDHLAAHEVPKVEITLEELEEKETFRKQLEKLCQNAFSQEYSGDITMINLVGFGSLASGFATPGSDMDLAIVPQWKDPAKALEMGIDREIPRILEKAILDAKLGGRLLTRTRVPIIKVCQTPPEELYAALLEERKKWDELPEEEKWPALAPPEPSPQIPVEVGAQKGPQPAHNPEDFPTIQEAKVDEAKPRVAQEKKAKEEDATKDDSPSPPSKTNESAEKGNNNGKAGVITNEQQPQPQPQPRNEKPWLREKALGPLDFPKTGVGIQCDINFENPLGLHNTHLLRCYSLTDPRVRPMVLFVKAWAKRRKINSSYSGTLSSYGWVLMVLHYLVNVAQPAVCPNLQSQWRPPANTTDVDGLQQMFKNTMVAGYAVRFWRNENEILRAGQQGYLTRNKESVGSLLRGFFQYYASVPQGFTYGGRPPSFYWTKEVLSLRTHGGIRTKAEKGWTGAKTTMSNGKEVRNRYLFCIEDPFELDHNVARTVTHNGIVAIRDEFRRAWKILGAIGRGQPAEGGIFDEVIEQAAPPPPPPPPPQRSETETETEQKTATTTADAQQIDGEPNNVQGAELHKQAGTKADPEPNILRDSVTIPALAAAE